MLHKLRSRRQLGIAGQAETDLLAKREVLRELMARPKSSKQDHKEVFQGLARDRARTTKARPVRAMPADGIIRFTSGGAPASAAATRISRHPAGPDPLPAS